MKRQLARPVILIAVPIAAVGMVIATCSRHPRESKEAMARGNQAWSKHDLAKAVASYSEALRLNPQNAAAYNNRGVAYMDQHAYGRAIADFNEAIRLRADYAEAYNNRGSTYCLEGDFKRSLGDFDQAIRLKPNYAQAYFDRGNAYAHLHDDDRAISNYGQAIRLEPKSTRPREARAYAYEAKGEYRRSIADLRTVIDHAPGDPDAYNSLAWLLAVCPDGTIRNGKQAVAYANEACRLTQWGNAAYLDTLAAAYAEQGDFVEAVKWETKYLDSGLSRDETRKGLMRLHLYRSEKPYREDLIRHHASLPSS